MCKKLLDSIKTLFSKDKKDKATLEVNVSNQSQDKINSKSKRIKNGRRMVRRPFPFGRYSARFLLV